MENKFKELVQELRALVCSLNADLEWRKSHSGFVTKHDLQETEKKIMSAIATFATQQNAFNDRTDAAITGLQGDIQSLNDTIAALQASSGAVTPEDQALLDQLTARGQAAADKLDALDALTPPVVPKV